MRLPPLSQAQAFLTVFSPFPPPDDTYTVLYATAVFFDNKNRLFATFLYALGGIKVDRDALSFDFVSKSLEVLDDGGTIGVFPEARIPINGKRWPFTVSTAFIATHTDAPIVPVYTDGNYGLFKRTNVMIGEKIYLKNYCKEGFSQEEQLKHLTKILEDKVYELKDELDRRVGRNNADK